MKNLKFTVVALAFFAVVAFASDSSPKSGDEYQNWKNQPSEPFSDPKASFEQVKKILLEKYFDKSLTEEQLYQYATDGMLRALNGPDGGGEKEVWNTLLTPTEKRELETDLKGEMTGIGVAIKFDSTTGIASVIGLVPQSVAEKDGIQVGDQIVSVNGRLYKGLQLRDVVYDIRGKAGDKIRLKILRGDQVIAKNVVREKMSWSPVEASVLDGKVGLLDIQHFNANTAPDVKAALAKFSAEKIKSLIIDMRGNSGGLFDSAVESAGYFLPKDSVVVRVESRAGKEEVVKTESDPLISDVPVAILVDGETASGAELFTASLAENLHAQVFGAKTRGKWNAQSVEVLPNQFAIKYTIKLFKSPNEKSYQDVGMEPDVSVASAGERSAKFSQADPMKKRLSEDAAFRAAYRLLSST
jgi:carboxyl-terminal processing protease